MARTFTRASSHYITATLAAAFGQAHPFSVAAWLQAADETSDHFAFGPSAIAAQSMLNLSPRGDIANDPIYGYRFNGANTGMLPSTTNYAASTWYHVCVVEISTTSRKLFINGTQETTNAQSVGALSATHMVYGCFYSNNARSSYLGGLLQHCAGWEVELSDGQVAALAKGFSPRHVRLHGLKFYDPCIRTLQSIAGNAPTAWTDSSGGVVEQRACYGY